MNRPGRFALTIGFSAVMGALAVVSQTDSRCRGPGAQAPFAHAVPFLEMTRYAPFRKLLWEVLGWSLAYGGMNTFTVAFARIQTGWADNEILLVASTAFLGGLGSLWLLGSRLDRFGSRPVLILSFILWIGIAGVWALVAGRAVSLHSGTPGLQVLMGLFAALINMANTRLAMAIIPTLGRSHFFAIYSVVLNVSLGLSPIGWGLMIYALRPLALRIRFGRDGVESIQRFLWSRRALFCDHPLSGPTPQKPAAARMEVCCVNLSIAAAILVAGLAARVSNSQNLLSP